MKDNEKARCFVLLAKFTGRKSTQEETFAKHLQISSFSKNWKDLVENIQYDTAVTCM